MKRIVVGDIHGCFDEFRDLLDKIGPSEDDEIVAVGDICNRGPNSADVVDFFRENRRAVTILGNHEVNNIMWAARKRTPSKPQIVEYLLSGERFPEMIEYFRALPLYLEFEDFIAVHAALDPRRHLSNQKRRILIKGYQKNDPEKNELWKKLYSGTKWVFYGHEFRPKPHIVGQTVGLDAGCCFGGALGAVVMPDMKFYSVKSRKNYWEELKTRFSADIYRLKENPPVLPKLK